jgi:hypothetical protein
VSVAHVLWTASIPSDITIVFFFFPKYSDRLDVGTTGDH